MNRFPSDWIADTGAIVGFSRDRLLYARNLVVTRLYRCPVIYCEPYVMNSKDAFARIQTGDYERTRNVNGRECKSTYREYADRVVDGLVDYYSKAWAFKD